MPRAFLIKNKKHPGLILSSPAPGGGVGDSVSGIPTDGRHTLEERQLSPAYLHPEPRLSPGPAREELSGDQTQEEMVLDVEGDDSDSDADTDHHYHHLNASLQGGGNNFVLQGSDNNNLHKVVQREYINYNHRDKTTLEEIKHPEKLTMEERNYIEKSTMEQIKHRDSSLLQKRSTLEEDPHLEEAEELVVVVEEGEETDRKPGFTRDTLEERRSAVRPSAGVSVYELDSPPPSSCGSSSSSSSSSRGVGDRGGGRGGAEVDPRGCDPSTRLLLLREGSPVSMTHHPTAPNHHDRVEIDPTCIYPSPSPSSEDSLYPRDDTSTSGTDSDEPRDHRPSRGFVMSPSLRHGNRYHDNHSQMRSSWASMTSQPPLLPSPQTSPEPAVEADDERLEENSRKRRRSDGDDEEEDTDVGLPLSKMRRPYNKDDVILRHHHNEVTSLDNRIAAVNRVSVSTDDVGGPRRVDKRSTSAESLSSPPSSTSPSPSTFWQSHLAASVGMGMSMAMHHPYLALSFQRLQQLHMSAAAQDGLPKLSPFHPHLALPPPGHPQQYPHPRHPQQYPRPGQTSPLPFVPMPSAMHGAHPSTVPLASSTTTTSNITPTSPVQARSSDYPYSAAASVSRLDRPRHNNVGSDFLPQSTSVKHPGTGTVILPPQRLHPQVAIPPGESLPLDLDTKTAAEKRKRREGEPPRYNCEACGKTYSTFSGLSKHKQFHCSTHVQKQFNCKYCDKTYVSLGALKMHIRTHTLPCKCHLCGKAFSRPWLLQGHVRTHTGEKPFQCAHCGRSFADRSNLRAHLQTHSDVKKYSCRSCSKTFSRMSLLLKHEDGGCAGIGH